MSRKAIFFDIDGTLLSSKNERHFFVQPSTCLLYTSILVLFVTLGVVLGALGIYEPLVEFAGAGATVPLTGFGYNMAKGTREAIQEQGLLGVFTGGVTAGAAGIAARCV